MSSQPNPRHLAWVDRLFSRFALAWGAPKLGAMFPAESHGEIRPFWAEQIGRFEPQTVGLALQAVIDAGSEWPPTLPEFVAACQQASVSRRAHSEAVALPMPPANPEIAESAIRQAGAAVAKRGPNRDWARKILARVAAGESVPMVSIDMARRALGVEAPPADAAQAHQAEQVEVL